MTVGRGKPKAEEFARDSTVWVLMVVPKRCGLHAVDGDGQVYRIRRLGKYSGDLIGKKGKEPMERIGSGFGYRQTGPIEKSKFCSRQIG